MRTHLYRSDAAPKSVQQQWQRREGQQRGQHEQGKLRQERAEHGQEHASGT